MGSSYVIFISFVLSLTLDYGLSEDQLASLAQIKVNQDATLQAKFDAIDPLFDTIGKYASALIWNVEAGTDDDSTNIAEALARAKDSTDYSLDTVLISVQDSCSAVEVSRNATHAYLEKIYATIGESVVLAQSGNYFENRPQLEENQASAQEDVENFVKSIFDSIRTCLNTNHSNTLTLTYDAQYGSGAGLRHVINAIFSAIKVYAAAVTDGTADVSLVLEIEDLRRYAHIGFRTDVEFKFSALRTLYIAAQLDQTGNVLGLASNQYALTVSFYRYQALFEAIFGTIETYLKKVALGLYDVGEADFSLTDAAQAVAAANLNAAQEIFLLSVQITNPNAIRAITAAKETFSALSQNLVASYFQAIEVCCKSKETFGIIRNSTLFNVGSYIDLVYGLLRAEETWDKDSEAKFTILQNTAAGLAQTAISYIFDAIEVLGNATCAKKATEEDSSAIKTAAAAVVSTLDVYTQHLSAAGIFALKARNAS